MLSNRLARALAKQLAKDLQAPDQRGVPTRRERAARALRRAADGVLKSRTDRHPAGIPNPCAPWCGGQHEQHPA
ncbi:protein of unknown function [Paraburkholderia dioscoreae]|uniref:Uncharacterized protein n=1 Tax=Paraburkholderia dioscoreae TaxID=2604047 RepID=A0A5Q4Z9B7_9BURK|nr:protein of unknown function [Paraburkholderia dioscoreae]